MKSTSTNQTSKYDSPAITMTDSNSVRKYKVVITRKLPEVPQKLLEEAKDVEIVQWAEDKPCSRDWLLQNVKGAAGILVMLTDRVDEEVVETAGEGLKVVSSFSVGTDHITHQALSSRSIRLGTTPHCLTHATADLALILTLMATRRIGESLRAVLSGKWPSMPWSPLLLAGPGVRGKTIGFLGFGRIGKEVLKRLVAFGVSSATVFRRSNGEIEEDYGVPVKRASSPGEVANESDIVIVACALSSETRHLVDEGFLQKMRKSAVLVNIARGPIVDTEALVKALKEEWIFGAGLDVVENEPNIPADHPLLALERCVVLPHVGSAETGTREMMGREAVENLLAGVRGTKMENGGEVTF